METKRTEFLNINVLVYLLTFHLLIINFTVFTILLYFNMNDLEMRYRGHSINFKHSVGIHKIVQE